MTKRGQSIIEYSLIAVLVILGVVTMGPYVLRSVGAHFKIWDDGVKDSFEENLTQAPVTDVPVINSACQFSYTSGDCGASQNGIHCDSNQRIYNLTYAINSPSGCDQNDPPSKCVLDDTCCTTYQAGPCGLTTVPSGGIPAGNAPLSNSSGLPSGCSVYGTNSCYYGQRSYFTQCSDLPYACCPDPQCNVQCTGQVSTDPSTGKPDATLCPDEPPLTAPQSISYVANGNCDVTKDCQYYCNAGYILNASGICTNQCPATPLPPSAINTNSQFVSPDPILTPPSGQNYYFFNFNTAGNGILSQTVSPASGVVTPGQIYHLKMVSGRDPGDNHCDASGICDQDIVENDAGLLHIVVGDQNPGGEAPYDWQILDSNNKVVFEWSGLIDYSLDVAFTPTLCPSPVACSYNNGGVTGSWTGNYATACAAHADNGDSSNAYGDLYITMSCSGSILTGICLNNDPNNSNSNNDNANNRGYNKALGCLASNSPGIGCTWNGPEYVYWQDGNSNSSCYDSQNPEKGHAAPFNCYQNNGGNTTCSADYFTLTCNGSQLTSIQMNGPKGTMAAVNGCNWGNPFGAVETFNDFGYGNDMSLTCTTDSNGNNGAITQFSFTVP